MNIVPVIMAGGAGTRLWPMSREEKPKQFHNLSGSGTLLEETVRRLRPLSPSMCVVVTSKKYSEMSMEEVKKGGLAGTALAEPRPRNTAAAVLYAAVYLDKLMDDSIMIVLPADHFIRDNEAFTATLRAAVTEAEKGSLVTIGIKPSYPETGYGYIKAVDGASGSAMEVERFVEKPDSETARGYVEAGTYFWNSGIFVWKTSAIIQAFHRYLPEMAQAFEPLHSLSAEKIQSVSADIWKHKETLFDSIESISIDYGILEKADNRVVIPSEFGWADLGSWKSIDDILEADSKSNRSPEKDNAIFVNSENCSVYSEGNRIAVVGLKNVVVVQAGNDILVIDKESSQDVRQVVEIVRQKK